MPTIRQSSFNLGIEVLLVSRLEQDTQDRIADSFNLVIEVLLVSRGNL